ncbi:MAG: GTPase HflX, partial [Microcella sp.]
DIPEIVAFNKSDLIDEDARLLLRGLEPTAVFVSAKTGEGIDELRARIGEVLPDPDVEVVVVVPYDRGELVALLHERGRILSTEYEEGGTRVHAFVSPQHEAQLAEFVVADATAAPAPNGS